MKYFTSRLHQGILDESIRDFRIFWNVTEANEWKLCCCQKEIERECQVFECLFQIKTFAILIFLVSLSVLSIGFFILCY